jgi:hypothetical protein
MDGGTINLSYQILMQGWVTNGSWFINLYTHNPLEEFRLIQLAERNLGCMLDPTCGSKIPCEPSNREPFCLLLE